MWARHRLEVFTAVLAAVLGATYLLLPAMGSDLAAQVARADFFAAHGYTPIDLRWYAGVNQLGYSLISQPVMALLGVRLTGALCLPFAAVLLAVLLRRTDAPRPLLGALVGTACLAGNLVSGRVTYGLGVCLALGALVALTTRQAPAPISAGWPAALLTLLAGATSPVVALFLGLAGVALILSGRVRSGLLLAIPAAVPLALTALLFGDGGWMNISRTDTLRAVIAGLVVAALVPRRPVRIGALLSSAGVLAASLIHTPVGLNATRLAVMFTLPLLAAYATLPVLSRTSPWTGAVRPLPGWAVVILVAVACWWQPPVVTGDVRDIGNPTADAAYFRPLLDRLAQESLTGRVEIPATRDYWEAAHMGDVPLARGWLRQADIDRNPLFFTEIPGARGTGVPLTADTYRAWLDELAVQFVAVPDAELTWSGRPEAELIKAGLPYLTELWSNADWRLYAVADPRPIVAAPARLVRQDAASLTFDATPGTVPVRVRWNRWLTVDNDATLERQGDWLAVKVTDQGRYTISS
ncbi:hypothetical protein [Paractinoplanes hotanensis]|uniref:MFS transporter n=1 Tax=Paractinoplanes hotanensis TaxID=2906497 RepID=A0ABT0YFE6_9ACTN|nr:hypothetical protein [Actinoplanes hotanensis]MCM4084773.1 hypothetical protein [Actinoplanes hotanensis]